MTPKAEQNDSRIVGDEELAFEILIVELRYLFHVSYIKRCSDLSRLGGSAVEVEKDVGLDLLCSIFNVRVVELDLCLQV